MIVKTLRQTWLLFITLVTLLFTNLSCVIFDSRYSDILEEARSENIHFAFMKLQDYLRGNPDSRHTAKIKFAICEYYFEIKDYRDAIRKLSEFIIGYPRDQGINPAKALLYKSLLEYQQEGRLLEKIKENFFSKSLFLTFSETKTKHYRSLFNNDYKIVDYIDRIEVFKNNELILKITP